jgi:hypothetical protein
VRSAGSAGPLAYGSVDDRQRLRSLPTAGSVWSLLETTDGASIVDRIEGGGLAVGEPGRLGIHGSSWTQTTFALDGLDVTDPDRGGLPLVFPDLGALDAVEVTTALAPVEQATPGPRVTLLPRRPGRDWTGSLDASLMPAALEADPNRAEAPSLASLGSWRDLMAVGSGPIDERLGVLVASRLTRAQRFDADDPTPHEGRLTSGLLHAVFTPAPADELRLLASAQQATGARHLHLQPTWRHRAATAWSLSAGYTRGRFDAAAPVAAGSVERLRDGPLPERIGDGPSTRSTWQLAADLAPDLRSVLGGRHAVRVGAMLARNSDVTSPRGDSPLVGERVAGLPARAWAYGRVGTSRWHATELAAFAADRILLGPLAAEAGVRYERTQARATAGGRITWNTLAPRVSLRLRLARGAGLVAFAGYARYSHRLPLRALAFGDPAAAQGTVARWNDANGDLRVQPSEVGPIVARLGPGGSTSEIDSNLARPFTDETLAGIELRQAWLRLRLAGYHRRERSLLESVNTGVPSSAYDVRFVPDPGGDLLGPQDDQLLPVYDRRPESFGADHYRLTNPRDHTTLAEGVELLVEATAGGRLQVRVSGAAFRADGYGGNRGFRALENDQGVLGEQFDTPNAFSDGRGRLFFDRAYSLKVSGLWRAPWQLQLGAIVRYQDGQPFARIVVLPDLRQGPDPVQAIPNGRSRFGYTFTCDARVEKGLRFPPFRGALVAEAFNLLDNRREVEEDVLTGATFRRTTRVQPPRAVRLGVRIAF